MSSITRFYLDKEHRWLPVPYNNSIVFDIETEIAEGFEQIFKEMKSTYIRIDI